MVELLVKSGDNAPHKDLMFYLSTSDAGARSAWKDRLPVNEPQLSPAELTDRLREAEVGCWRQGDIVQARPDGWDWGKRESYPRFYVVRISDVLMNGAGFVFDDKVGQQRILSLEETLLVDPESDLDYYHRRRFWLPDVSGLKTSGVTEIPLARLALRTGYTEYDSAKALPHNSAGTFTIRSAAGDYTSLTGWDAGEAMDLTAAPAGHSIADCYDDWPTGLSDGNLDLNTDWTADADNMPQVTVHSGERHLGVPGDGFWWISSGTRVLLVRCAYAHMGWVEVDASGNSFNSFYSTSDSNVITLDYLIVRGLYGGAAGGGRGFENYNGGIIRSSGFTSTRDQRILHDDIPTFYNCSFHISGLSVATLFFRRGVFYNCAAYCTTSPVNGVYYSDCTGDYNAGSDASAPGANSQDNADFNWTDPANGDFTLVDATGDLDANGNAYGGMAATAITGEAWESPPAIGADEFVAAPGGLSIPIAMHHYKQLMGV